MARKKKTEDGSTPSLFEATLAKWEDKTNIMTLRQLDESASYSLSTGSLSLDYLINPQVGGMYRGQVLEFWGGYSTGKTTIALALCLNATANGLRAYYLDAENALRADLIKNIGVDPDLFVINSDPDGAVTANVLEDVIKTGEVGVAVIDSISMWKPLPENKKKSDKTKDVDITATKMAEHSSFLTTVLPQLAKVARQHNTLLILINQERTNIGSWGYSGKPSGGKIVEHVDSVRIRLSGNAASAKRRRLLDYRKIPIGQYTEANCDKNKINAPLKKVELPFFWGKGVNPYLEAAHLALLLDVVKSEGGGMYKDWEGNTIVRGLDNFHQAMANDLDVYKRVRQKVIEHLGIKYPEGQRAVNPFHDENFVRNDEFIIDYNLLPDPTAGSDE